jgi:outer membrane lipoprotein-sorting protein
MKPNRIIALLFCLAAALPTGLFAQSELSARDIVQASVDLWRGETSYSQIEMTIHRPDWQRTLKMESWTRGPKDALIRFNYPARDAGNATLKVQNDMWIFTPKIQRVTRLPASMMHQSWMGSDFSYQDLARSDQGLEQYDYRLIETRNASPHRIYVIEARPKPNAPVVWGKEVAQIREDFVLLETVFYDQAMQPVKRMETRQIDQIAQRPFPTLMRIQRLNQPEQWTEIHTTAIWINLELPDYLFTLANLQRPRAWQAPQTP